MTGIFWLIALDLVWHIPVAELHLHSEAPPPHPCDIFKRLPRQSGTAQMISALQWAGRVAAASATSPRQVLPSRPLTADLLCFLFSCLRRAWPFSPPPSPFKCEPNAPSSILNAVLSGYEKKEKAVFFAQRGKDNRQREPSDFSAIQQSCQLTKRLLSKVQTLIVTVEKNWNPKNKNTDTKQKNRWL